VSSGTRILAFGSSAGLVVAGVLCAVLIEGVAGEAIMIGLVAAGLGGALLLLFAEVGLSEDRDRDAEEDPSQGGARRRPERGSRRPAAPDGPPPSRRRP
jgi:hypothetical protein